ncbi:phytoene/squalene synthase family protein [Halocatena salina]|uniref:Phytoene/squalene synthase family protein n=1 Tax=Halocatena salina TaxID=2934340 RepID=A0A8U0A8H1_9EURY|nr:phytoene/squalene synthase family protein [Halocatena salina]UPM44217.1 phytoene/squalene synthase family protein [Halocatena salina]
MVDTTQVRESKTIQQQTGTTFHLATRLLPRRVRHATYVLYAFFRISDEIVDDPGDLSPTHQRTQLEHLRAAALGKRESDNPVVAAFADLRREHDIATADVNTFIDAMATDITKRRYDTYAELEAYMDGSAAAVGRMMTSVMLPGDPSQALPHATALGEAFQLTNFLRDVREDVLEYGRIYLPRSTLQAHDVTAEQIERLEFTDGFAAAVQSELERTEALYRRGVDGIAHLPNETQFAVLLAAVLYADHHRLIREQGYDVLSNQPTLSITRRVELLVRTWWHWRRTNDPRSTFETVSSLVTNEGGYNGEREAGSNGGVREEWTVLAKRFVGSVQSRISLICLEMIRWIT